MNTIDYCVIIDNNASRTTLLESCLKELKVFSNIKSTLNCGHGLVYLKEMWEKVGEKKTLVILNTNTPIMDGKEFLDELKGTPYSKSNQFLLVALNESLNEKEIALYKSRGISNFISAPFCYENIFSIIQEKFQLGEKAGKKESKPEPAKNSTKANKPMNNKQ